MLSHEKLKYNWRVVYNNRASYTNISPECKHKRLSELFEDTSILFIEFFLKNMPTIRIRTQNGIKPIYEFRRHRVFYEGESIIREYRAIGYIKNNIIFETQIFENGIIELINYGN